jgi:hypothetical protein
VIVVDHIGAGVGEQRTQQRQYGARPIDSDAIGECPGQAQQHRQHGGGQEWRAHGGEPQQLRVGSVRACLA